MKGMKLWFAAGFVSFGLLGCATTVDEESDDPALGIVEQELSTCDYDKAKADRLGNTARSGAGARSQSRCYRFVKNHLTNAGFRVPPAINGGSHTMSAAMFEEWADRNPNDLQTMGLKRVTLAANEKPPMGAVVVWGRGECGFSKKHGHIEVVCAADGSRACSDFNGRLRSGPNCNPAIYVPIPSGDAGADCGVPDSCQGRSDGTYCSTLRDNVAFTCKDGVLDGTMYCESNSQSCGTPGEPAYISGNKLDCQ